jgi:hypothetical protein
MKYENISTKDIYTTTDFAVAVSLSYFGFKLLGLEKNQLDERVSFQFERADGLDQTLQAFWEDSLQVSPKRWHTLSRELKSRINSELRRD